MSNMKTRGIQSGFDFLFQPAGFDIGEGWLNYDSIDPYWKAFLVGLVNTLRVAIVGIVLTTILGTLLGIGRFSRNALVRGLCYGYVETFRNIPVLLQLLMWYLLFTEYLPAIDEALHIGSLVYVSKNGLSYPTPVWQLGQTLAVVGALLSIEPAFEGWMSSDAPGPAPKSQTKPVDGVFLVSIMTSLLDMICFELYILKNKGKRFLSHVRNHYRSPFQERSPQTAHSHAGR
jgi:His/Glu/Gln/Arg/opine family amino acid ABC transporter permease subunit